MENDQPNAIETRFHKAVESKTKLITLSGIQSVLSVFRSRLPNANVSVTVADDDFSMELDSAEITRTLQEFAEKKRGLKKIALTANSFGKQYRSLDATYDSDLKSLRFWVYGTAKSRSASLIDWGRGTVSELNQSQDSMLVEPGSGELIVSDGKVSYFEEKKSEKAGSPPLSGWSELRKPAFIITTILAVLGLVVAYFAWVHPKQ